MARLYIQTATVDYTGAKTRLNVSTISAITKRQADNVTIETMSAGDVVNQSTGTYYVPVVATDYSRNTLYYIDWTFQFTAGSQQVDRRLFQFSNTGAISADMGRSRLIRRDVRLPIVRDNRRRIVVKKDTE